MTPYLPLFAAEPCEPHVRPLEPQRASVRAPLSPSLSGEPQLPAPVCSPLRTLEVLARQIRDMETAGRPVRESIPSGCPSIDRHLPHGGHARGSMVELIRHGTGSGVSSLALMIARQAMDEGKFLIVVDTQRQFYPPAMKSLGIPLERVIALQPANHADAIWGIDQALRCQAVGAVLAEIGTLEDRVARRLQLAAEQGGGLGVLLRDTRSARTQPSWADVQWMVRCDATRNLQLPTSATQHQDVRWFELELARCNGGRTGARFTVGVDACGRWIDAPTKSEARYEQASALHLAAQLAQPTRRRRDIAG
jgi:protein ImuA